MFNDLKTAKMALAEVHRNMEAIDRLTKPPSIDFFDQIERILEPIRQLEITRTSELAGVADRLSNIQNANRHLQGILRQSVATSRIADSLNAAHQSWLDRVKHVSDDLERFSRLQAHSRLTLCDTSLQLAATNRLMAKSDFGAISNCFQIKTSVIFDLENSIAQTTESYGRLADSLKDISDITRLPAFVLPGATREIYDTEITLESLSSSDKSDEDDTDQEIQLFTGVEYETPSCLALLQQVDPELVRLYIGANQALISNNADRARHIVSSLRELCNRVLWRLAPDDLVSAWIVRNKMKKELLNEGRPTRRARILYICREIDNEPLSDFLTHDTKAFVKLIELFNQQVHKLQAGLTDEQLRAIFYRTESGLKYILQICLETSGK
ncbi:MAG: hypothetical protein OXI88_22940 [Gammaproteobacteria bacterium]|nr:hypothetical protein [Gammaproteobacteria bacterium]